MYKSHYSIWDAKSDVTIWGKAYTYHRARQSHGVFKSLWLIWVASQMIAKDDDRFAYKPLSR